MFSGIVETQSAVLKAQVEGGLVRIEVQRPAEFADLRIGDSVSTNGVCLTIEKFDSNQMTFALGAETLKVTGWNSQNLQARNVNLERSLRFGDRVHGHMVSGHVDDVAKVIDLKDLGGSLWVEFQVPDRLLPMLWPKGSWAVDGVSLTINGVEGQKVSVCLIPETVKRTTLGALTAGQLVNVEVDMLARGLMRLWSERKDSLTEASVKGAEKK